MSRNNFTQLYTGDPSSDQVQGYIATALQPLLQLPFASGTRVQDVEVTTSDTFVNHGLESTPEGFIVLKSNAAQVVYESSTENDSPDRFIILRAGGTVTVDLFFF